MQDEVWSTPLRIIQPSTDTSGVLHNRLQPLWQIVYFLFVVNFLAYIDEETQNKLANEPTQADRQQNNEHVSVRVN